MNVAAARDDQNHLREGTWHADVPEMPGSVKGLTIAEARERLRVALGVYVEGPVTLEKEISW